MHKNVCFLYGVNGVGKSSLASQMRDTVPDAVQVSGSNALCEAFGAVSREALEHMDAARKRDILYAKLEAFFAEHAACPLIICDTHLTVALRKNGKVTYENMWDDRYMVRGLLFANVVASAQDVLRRRLVDERKTGRKRHSDIRGIEADIALNDSAFQELQLLGAPTLVLFNGGSITGSARRALQAVRMCQKSRVA